MKTRSNTKAYMENVKDHIMGAIEWEGYDIDEPKTDAAKLRFVLDTFKSEYGHGLKRCRTHQEALASWFAGVPTACQIEVYNDAILALARKWGSLDETSTEREEYAVLDNWFNFMACKFLQIARKEGVELNV